MRRWSLARALRARQRDWSPLPLTLSTTNAQLMRNYLDGEVAAHNGEGNVESAGRKGEASLRWRLRQTEVRLSSFLPPSCIRTDSTHPLFPAPSSFADSLSRHSSSHPVPLPRDSLHSQPLLHPSSPFPFTSFRAPTGSPTAPSSTSNSSLPPQPTILSLTSFPSTRPIRRILPLRRRRDSLVTTAQGCRRRQKGGGKRAEQRRRGMRSSGDSIVGIL
jgi:hypothetical protein